MKRNLHYCTYEIWDGFKEDIKYTFYILKDRVNIDILLEKLPKVDKNKIDELVDTDIAKHRAKFKREDNYQYFGEVRKKKIKIGDYPAVFVSYEFNRVKEGESDFKDRLRVVENCYIMLKDSTLVIKGSTYLKFYKTIQSLWEDFYTSYKPDQAQAFKTNYGSFKWVQGLVDNSIIDYFGVDLKGKVLYKIEISYLNDKDKDEVNQKISSLPEIIESLTSKFNFSNSKKETFSVDGHKIQYDEIFATDGDVKLKLADIRIFEFTPGILIEVTEAKSGCFDKFRNELDALIKSIKFYPDLKKD
jgi:hypothetical protein